MGREIVVDLARDHDVHALGRNPEKLADLTALDNVTAHAVDYELLLAEESLDLDLPTIDLLVHATGVANRRSLEQATAADWQEQLTVNTVIPALLTRQLLPALKRARGQVVFVNSIAGQAGARGNVVYSASKWALRGIADALRKEVREDDVRVASLFPSGTDTAMMREMSAQLGDDRYHPEYYTAPVEIARAVRLIADTGETTQFTDLNIRPRRP